MHVVVVVGGGGGGGGGRGRRGIVIIWKFFTPALADGFPVESE